MPGCACCNHAGSRGNMSGCRCFSSSTPCLPSIGANAPVHRDSPNYVAFNAPLPEIIISDIFRPPQA
jgi:hypothetical protein